MKAIIFSPFAGFWKQYYLDVLIANSLSKKNDVFLVSCNQDILTSCMYLNSFQEYNSENYKFINKHCEYCKRNSKLNKNKNIKQIYLSEYLSEVEKTKIKEFKSTNFKFKELINFKINNTPIGKLSLYDFILLNKLNNLDQINDRGLINYKKHIISNLNIHFAIENIFSENNFDLMLTSNQMYSPIQTVIYNAKKRNIRCLNICSGKNFNDKLNKVSLFEPIRIHETEHLLKYWDKIKSSIVLDNFEEIKNYIKAIFKKSNKMIYSSSAKKNIYPNYIKDNRKKVLIVLSGADENLSAIESGNDITANKGYKRIFKNQKEWLEDLIVFSEKKKDYLFIIRPHPRDWPKINSKYAISDNYYFLKNLKNNLSVKNNILFDEPENKFPIYNHIPHIDLCLTYGSTVGIEFSLFGIPVLDGDIFKLGYPVQLNKTYKNKEEYFRKLESRDVMKINKNDIVNSFRWLKLVFTIDTLDIKYKLVKKSDNLDIQNIFKKGFFKTMNILLNNFEEKFDLFNSYLPNYAEKILNKITKEKDIDSILTAKKKLNYFHYDANAESLSYERNIFIFLKLVLTKYLPYKKSKLPTFYDRFKYYEDF